MTLAGNYDNGSEYCKALVKSCRQAMANGSKGFNDATYEWLRSHGVSHSVMMLMQYEPVATCLYLRYCAMFNISEPGIGHPESLAEIAEFARLFASEVISVQHSN